MKNRIEFLMNFNVEYQPSLRTVKWFLIWVMSLGLLSCSMRPGTTKTNLNIQMPERVLSDSQSMSTGKINLQTDDGGRNVSAPADITRITPRPQTEKQWAVQRDPRLQFDDSQTLTVVVDTLPLPDFVHRVFGDMLHVNYVLDSRVPAKEKVSLNLQEPVSKRRLFETVRDILRGYTVAVREKDGIFYIEPVSDKASLAMGQGTSMADIPDVPGQIRQIIPLQHANATNLMQIMTAVPGTQVIALPGENALIVMGAREGIEQILQFISVLDQPSMRGRFGSLVRLKYWDPQELAPKLRDILGTEGIPVSSNSGMGGIQLIPFDRWRFLLAFAAEQSWLDRLGYWIQLLDVPKEQDERQYFVYFPESSRASELMGTLESILGLTRSSKGKTATKGKTGPMEMTRPAGTTVAQSEKKSVETGESDKESQLAILAEEIRLAIDEGRNAMIIYCTPQKYRMVESLLKQLDIQPPQVLIEATVAEVTLSDDLSFGLEWYLKSTEGQQTSVLSTIGGLALGSAGLNYSFLADSDKLKVLVNALAKDEKVKVLSSPHLTVRDGKSASINVGTQVPVVTSETAQSQNPNGVVRAYQYRSTGVMLQVTPTVHAHGVVTLEINQEVSEPAQSGGENPLILNRTLQTEVVAGSGQTVIIGGLIKESNSESVKKVPVLGDIPVIGYLFKTTTRGLSRTELVVMITPHIIRSTQQIDDMRREVMRSYQAVEIGEGKQ